jgi:hypothetical protein
VQASAAAAPPAPPALPTPRLRALAADFAELTEGQERLKLLLQLGGSLPAYAAERSLQTRVMGCTSQTWLAVDLERDGSVRISGAYQPPAWLQRRCGRASLVVRRALLVVCSWL